MRLGDLKGLEASRITTDQLKRLLTAARGESDPDVATEIEGLELSQRLTSAELTAFLAEFPGNRARKSLLVLADLSAFLDPSPSEIPSLETPDAASQRQMIALAVNYINNTLHHLPNFYATRVTTTFRREMWSDKPLHPVGRYSDVQLYRDGQLSLQPSRPQSRSSGLTTSGEFGPILGTAILDAARGNLSWSHWEKGAAGPLAVYRYAVKAKESHYVVQDKVSGYKGEIAIDPSSGAIMRIVLRTDAAQEAPLAVANIVVEYGPVNSVARTTSVR